VAAVVKAPFVDLFRIHTNPPSRRVSHSFSSRKTGSTVIKKEALKIGFSKTSFDTRPSNVLAVLREIHEVGIKPNQTFHSALIYAGTVVNLFDKAPKLKRLLLLDASRIRLYLLLWR